MFHMPIIQNHTKSKACGQATILQQRDVLNSWNSRQLFVINNFFTNLREKDKALHIRGRSNVVGGLHKVGGLRPLCHLWTIVAIFIPICWWYHLVSYLINKPVISLE